MSHASMEMLAHIQTIFEVHGTMGCVAWGIVAPIGAITIRLVPSTKAWIIHGGIMLLALSLFTVNFSIGVSKVLAYKESIGKTAHFILGTTLFALAWAQPFVGTAHHYLYKMTGKRTLLSALHVFFGRLLMLVGMINGGVGLLLAKNSTRTENIVYGTLVGVIWTTYVIVSLGMEVKREEEAKSGRRMVGDGEEVEGSERGSGSGSLSPMHTKV